MSGTGVIDVKGQLCPAVRISIDPEGHAIEEIGVRFDAVRDDLPPQYPDQARQQQTRSDEDQSSMGFDLSHFSHRQVTSRGWPARRTVTLVGRPAGTSCIQTRRRFIASAFGKRLPLNLTRMSPAF